MTLPAAFFGHGSPMNTLEHNAYTEAWRTFGATVERPRALLVVSAHWYVNATAVTAMERPRVIHDFYGFPDELFAFDYPAPGSPELAARVADVVEPVWVGLDVDSWGLDHGTWSVLAHVFPEHDLPVVQLALNATQPFEYHLDLGRRLAPLRDDGILVLGSGNLVHHLGRIDWRNTGGGYDWAERFDAAALDLLTSAPEDVLRLREHADFDAAVPTPDHFLPLLYLAGMAMEAGPGSMTPIITGCTMGSMSMTSYAVGPVEPVGLSGGAAAEPPPPEVVPPEDTNI